MRIALFITCVNDTLFPEAGRATVQILERLGHTVSFPPDQTCCGQMHANSGYEREALPLLRRFVQAFSAEGIDAVVSPSGSCVAMVRHHYARLAVNAGDQRLSDEVAQLAPHVYELSEFLVDVLKVQDVGAYYPHRVAYHPSCHALRTLGIREAPLRLLSNVRGLDLVELQDAHTCCGFGGTFAVKNPDVSAAMLVDKLRAVLDVDAEVCAALDSSCLMHIGGGLSRQRAGVRTVHLAEILAAQEAR